jgi:hypothetical protein
MTNIVPLNSQIHRELRVDATPSVRYGDNRRFVPVIVNEFPFLIVHYPVLFSKDANTGVFYAGAVLGFDEGENLFLDDGRDAYRPLNMQRGAFFTAGDDIAIDLSSPRVGSENGERLFGENGEPTAYLKSIIQLFRELVPGLERTKVFIETLLKLNLIEPIEFDLGFDDGSKREVTGLYTVSQDALRDLPDGEVVALFRRGYLHLIYLMIASLRQVPLLAQKKNRRFVAGLATPHA